jgi:hypothetical protein
VIQSTLIFCQSISKTNFFLSLSLSVKWMRGHDGGGGGGEEEENRSGNNGLRMIN